MQVLAAIDFIDAHILPFYHNKASTGMAHGRFLPLLLIY